MNKLKGIISVVGLIVKYSAIVMAIIKGIEVAYNELEKIDLSATPEPSKKTKIETNE